MFEAKMVQQFTEIIAKHPNYVDVTYKIYDSTNFNLENIKKGIVFYSLACGFSVRTLETLMEIIYAMDISSIEIIMVGIDDMTADDYKRLYMHGKGMTTWGDIFWVKNGLYISKNAWSFAKKSHINNIEEALFNTEKLLKD